MRLLFLYAHFITTENESLYQESYINCYSKIFSYSHIRIEHQPFPRPLPFYVYCRPTGPFDQVYGKLFSDIKVKGRMQSNLAVTDTVIHSIKMISLHGTDTYGKAPGTVPPYCKRSKTGDGNGLGTRQ